MRSAFFREFVWGEESPTMIEYALLLALIALAVIAVASAMGSSISAVLYEPAARAFSP
jgi:Flp pilus assembly pilin Flp